MAPDLLFNPITDERETPTGVTHRKVIHPTAKNRIDRFDQATDGLGLEQFRVLGEFRGIPLPVLITKPDLIAPDRAFLAELTSHFHSLRKATRQRRAAATVTLAVTMTVGLLLWTNYRNTQRDALLRRAEVSRAAGRFDEAEAALAHAWSFDSAPGILNSYREARSRRVLERPVQIAVTREEGVVAVDEADGAPYVVVHASDNSEGLFFVRKGQRFPLAVPCDVAPNVVTRGALIVWTCGASLGAMLIGQSDPFLAQLPTEPVHLQLVDGYVKLLFREGPVAQVGKFQVPTLQPAGLDVLREAPDGGEMNFCPQSDGIWSFRASDGKIVLRKWSASRAQPHLETFTVAESSGIGFTVVSWISRVMTAQDCNRFFVEYAPFTLGPSSNFEIARIRIDSPRPLDRFDSSITQLAAAPDESGLEAVYLTESKELRAFVLTSPVVLTTRVRTLAADVQTFVPLAFHPHEMWTLALDRQLMSFYRNQELWSRQPLGVGESVRAVVSPNSDWVVVEGDEATILWKRAETWNGSAPPSPDLIETETRLPQ